MRNALTIILLAAALQLSAQTEITQIRSGDMAKYISNGSGSAHGLKYIFRYPKSFQPKDEGSSMIFGSSQGKLLIELTVTKSNDIAPKPRGKQQGNPEALMINSEEWKYTDYEEEQKSKVGKTTFVTYARHRLYMHQHSSYLVTIDFIIRSDESSDAVKSKFNEYQDTFLTEVKTFAILSDWGK